VPEARADAGARQLSLERALRRPRPEPAASRPLKTSKTAREYFGDAFVDQYVAFRQWEVERFQRAVTDWERRRYLEMV